MGEFINYTLDQLTEMGYTPVGRPALIVGRPDRVKPEELEAAIKKTNGDIIYDELTSYWRTNIFSYDAKNHAQIIGDIEGDANFMIVLALKKD